MVAAVVDLRVERVVPAASVKFSVAVYLVGLRPDTEYRPRQLLAVRYTDSLT